MAYVTGVLLGFLTVVGLPYKYLLDGDASWYAVGWMLHGWAYIIYVAFALDLVFRLRWSLLRALGVVLAGTIPFMSFVAERRVTHAVDAILEGNAEGPRSAGEAGAAGTGEEARQQA